MELHKIQHVGPLQGNTLNVEEVAGLEVAMTQRQLQENLVGTMYFWGKIFGSVQDYLVVFHTNPFDEFPDRRFYFW